MLALIIRTNAGFTQNIQKNMSHNSFSDHVKFIIENFIA